MLQNIAGTTVYVVDFDTMPELPITGLTEHEQKYRKILHRFFGNLNGTLGAGGSISPYAEALTAAIETGVITEPGKYGIEVNRITRTWNVYKIIE